MLNIQDDQNTQQWWVDRTQAAPAYAWSAEPAAPVSQEPSRRRRRVAAFAGVGAGAAAAAIAALVVTFSGTDSHPATPDTAPVVQAAPAPSAPMPAPVTPRQQVHYSQPASTMAPAAPQLPRTTSDDSSSYQPSHQQWHPTDDQWNFWRNHTDRSEHLNPFFGHRSDRFGGEHSSSDDNH